MITKLPNTILANLAKQQAYIAQSSSGRRSIKLEKGESWLIRFIPALMGPEQTFYARVAKHWMFKQSIVCPRHTDVTFGGSPDQYCPCCEVTESLMQDASKPVADFAYRCRASSQWLVWCIVLEKENGVAEPLNELLNPYEFWMYKTTYDEFMGFFKAGLRKSPDLSVFDYHVGNDFVISRTKKGVLLDKQDSGPIFDKDDPKFEKHVNKIEAAIKEPKVAIPKEKNLDDFADKIEENCLKEDSGGHSRRDADGDEEDAPERRPRGRATEEQPASRKRTAAPAEEEEEAEQEAPASRRRTTAPAENEAPRGRRAAAAPAEEDEDDPPRVTQPTARRSKPAATEDDDGDLAPATPAATRRNTPPPAARTRPTAQETEEEAEPEAEAQEERPRTRRATSAPTGRAAAASSTDEEEDGLPEEADDAAPPAKETADGDDDPPTTNLAKPVSRPAPSSRLINRIRQASQG